MKFSSAISLFIAAASVGGVAGCKKPVVRSYLAPKDMGGTAEAAPAPAKGGAADKARPQLTYMLPPGWEEAEPNSVSLAAFKIRNGTAEASVSITPLPNLAGREALVVNMWREQAGLPPVDDAELAKTLFPVKVGDESGQMFEVLGAKEGGAPLRIVTAFVHEADASWFYKLAGEEALVTAQKATFVEFLKTVRVHADATEPAVSGAPAGGPSSSPGSSGSSVPPSSPGSSQWAGPVPAGWQQLAPGNMQVAKFAVPAQGGAKAEVFVSVFPSDTGGLLANANRWRRQLGLPEVDQEGLKGAVSALDPAQPEAVLIDLKNEGRALLGAVVPRGGKWWFYKLLGDEPAVNAAREAFVGLAKTAP